MAGRTARVAGAFLSAAREVLDVIGAIAIVAIVAVVVAAVGGGPGMLGLNTAWNVAAGLTAKTLAFGAGNLSTSATIAPHLHWLGLG